MASKTNICNQALAGIGIRSTITSIDEVGSTEAKKCKLFYDDALEAALAAFNWNFARSSVALTLLGTAPQHWSYQYAYPNQCVAVRKILQPYKDQPAIPFEIASDPDSDAKIVLTDEPSAVVEYTKLVTNTEVFSGQFTLAFGAMLGSMLAMPLTGKQAKQASQLELFEILVQQARAQSLNEADPVPEPDAPWHQAR